MLFGVIVQLSCILDVNIRFLWSRVCIYKKRMGKACINSHSGFYSTVFCFYYVSLYRFTNLLQKWIFLKEKKSFKGETVFSKLCPSSQTCTSSHWIRGPASLSLEDFYFSFIPPQAATATALQITVWLWWVVFSKCFARRSEGRDCNEGWEMLSRNPEEVSMATVKVR